MVDIPRKSQARLRLIRRILYGAIALSALSGAGWYVSRLKPAAPAVDRSTVWIDTVKRGPMLRQVRGLGKLVPEEIRWIPAATEGRVERNSGILDYPRAGDTVRAPATASIKTLQMYGFKWDTI